VGPEPVLDSAVRRLDDLEQRWSRFIATSEISRLNEHAGEHVIVSPDTYLLVTRAIDAWQRTNGLFDPPVLPAVRAAGYDRDFAQVRMHAHARPTEPAPGCAGIECADWLRAITIPPGVALDPGGIGKGLAADVVSEEM